MRYQVVITVGDGVGRNAEFSGDAIGEDRARVLTANLLDQAIAFETLYEEKRLSQPEASPHT